MTEVHSDDLLAERFNRMGTRMHAILRRDIGRLIEKDKGYGRSWMKRGGVGAFMMLCRKWDRLEHRVGGSDTSYMIDDDRLATKWDIFEHLRADVKPEGLIDDIRDLRNYLLLVEEEMMEQGVLPDIVGDPDLTEDSTGMEHPFGFDADRDVVT